MNAYFIIMYMKFDAIRFTNVHVIYHVPLYSKMLEKSGRITAKCCSADIMLQMLL